MKKQDEIKLVDDIIAVIPDEARLPNHEAETLSASDWKTISCIQPQLLKSVAEAAPYEFSQVMHRRYKRPTFLPVKQIGGLKLTWESAEWMHIFLIIIATFLISRATSIALIGVPYANLVTLFVSFGTILLIEHAIASFINILLCYQEAIAIQNEILHRRSAAQKLENALSLQRVDSEQQIFDSVQSHYLLKEARVIPLVKLIFAVFLLGVEYVAALYYIQYTGQELNWINWAISLLGILFSLLASGFKGTAIDYPESRYYISKKYAQHWIGVNAEPLKRQILVFNKLTAWILRHPNSTPDQLEQVENKLWCQYLFKDYNAIELRQDAEIDALEQEEEKELAAIEENKTVTLPHKATENLKRQIQKKKNALLRRHHLELSLLEREMQERQCSVSFPDEKKDAKRLLALASNGSELEIDKQLSSIE